MKNEIQELITIRFPSREDLVSSMMEDVRVRMQGIGFQETLEIKVVLRELLENAIRHGNGGEASREVGVSVGANEKYLSITVSDQGKGFDVQRLNLELPFGDPRFVKNRGLVLIQALSSRMIINAPGNRVQVLFPRFGSIEQRENPDGDGGKTHE